MIIFTAKVSKKRILAFIAIVAVILVAVFWAAPDKEQTGQEPVSAQTSGSVGGIKTNKDRLTYLNGLGYQTTEEQPKSMQEVLIPKTFDATYSEYNLLQLECGFDLTGYKGKRVTLYTYGIKNYPGEENVLADLLVYKDKIIGGGVYTVALDGFMHGLRAADQKQ